MGASKRCYIILYYSYIVLAAADAISNNGNANIDVYSYGNSVSCAFGSKCVSLTECPLLNKVFNHACAYSNRIGDLGCGHPGSGMVCCPITTPDNSNGGCGTPLVQTGTQNQIGSNPWVARVIFKSATTGEIIFPCAGSIITNRIVLTAAHCVLAKGDNYKLFSVRVGVWYTATTSDYRYPVQDILISHAIVHPKYRPQTFEDNIALLVLQNRITYTVTAQPICLPEQWLVVSNYGTLVGWGRLAGQYEASSIQQAVQFPIVGLQQCFNAYGKTMPISANQVCVGGIPGRDACEGFGGAPLIQQHNGKHIIIGFLSYGSHQCGSGVPSVYTNLKAYVKWISSNIPEFKN